VSLAEDAIVPAVFRCPVCREFHVDALDPKTGIDWATRPHATHLCLFCGHLWFQSGWYNSFCGVQPTRWQRFRFWLKFDFWGCR
jgi:hypothetical protein